jgi:hypothetical protein
MPLHIETEASRVQKVDVLHSPTLESAVFTFSRGWAEIAKMDAGTSRLIKESQNGCVKFGSFK